MNDSPRPVAGCERARSAIHRILDEDSIPAELSRALRHHLADCRDCRELQADLATLRAALRSRPLHSLPEPALQAVWRRTVQSRGRSRSDGSPLWKAVAAAAILAFAMFGLWTQVVRRPTPSDSELARAAAQTRWVLKVTARALHKTERTAFRTVLGREVAGAVRRVPVQWPEATPAGRRSES